MEQPDPTQLLRHAAWRALQHPFFLAADLEAFRQRRGMQEADLARFLQCSPHTLPRLALCRRPNPDSPSFYSDIQRIAGGLGVDPTSLVRLLREVAALRALRKSDSTSGLETGQGLLLAARDAEVQEPHDQGVDSPARDDEPNEDGW